MEIASSPEPVLSLKGAPPHDNFSFHTGDALGYPFSGQGNVASKNPDNENS